MASDDEPRGRTRELRNGDVVREPTDCRFISSASNTVHERAEDNDGEFEYHPKCGQRLPPGSMWSRVDADTPLEAVVKFDLKPCTKCFRNSLRLARKRQRANSMRNSIRFDEDEILEEVLDDGDA
jgi:hypothetical protein